MTRRDNEGTAPCTAEHRGSCARPGPLIGPGEVGGDLPLARRARPRRSRARHRQCPQDMVEAVEDRRLLAKAVGDAQRLGRQPVAQVILQLTPFDAAVLVAEALGVGGAADRIEKQRREQPELPLLVPVGRARRRSPR
jgi:hypothetical protein